MKKAELLKEVVNFRTLLAGAFVLIIGAFMLYCSNSQTFWTNRQPLQSLVRDLGSLMCVSVVISLLWHLWASRAFLDEVLAQTKIADDVRRAGITGVSATFHEEIPWGKLFQDVTHFDIFFAYGRTWRNTYAESLRNVAQRERAHIRIVLPDPEDQQTVAELAKRFDYSKEELIKLIKEAEADFRSLRPTEDSKGTSVSLWFLPYAPQFTFYRFDSTAVLALYTHRRERIGVPTFIVEKGGSLYHFIKEDFKSMVKDGGLARRVF